MAQIAHDRKIQLSLTALVLNDAKQQLFPAGRHVTRLFLGG